MSPYLVCGYHAKDKEKIFELELPKARQHVIVPVEFDTSYDSNIFILEAVRKGRCTESKLKQNPPEHFDIYKGFLNFERALHEILSKHPYPFLQGPAVAILEKLLQPDNYHH